MKNISILLILLLLSACSTSPVDFKHELKTTADDKVTVNAAVRLAYQAYIKGCVVMHAEVVGKKKGGYMKCQKKAKSYIKEDVITIMESKQH